MYGIVPPREGRLNLIEEHEAEDAKTELEVYISRFVYGVQCTGKVYIHRKSLQESTRPRLDRPDEWSCRGKQGFSEVLRH